MATPEMKKQIKIRVVVKHSSNKIPTFKYSETERATPHITFTINHPTVQTRNGNFLKRSKSQQHTRPVIKRKLPSELTFFRKSAPYILVPLTTTHYKKRTEKPARLTPQSKAHIVFNKGSLCGSYRKKKWGTLPRKDGLKTMDTKNLSKQVEEHVRDTGITHPDIGLLGIKTVCGQVQTPARKVMLSPLINSIITTKFPKKPMVNPLTPSRRCVLTTVNRMNK